MNTSTIFELKLLLCNIFSLDFVCLFLFTNLLPFTSSLSVTALSFLRLF